MATPSIFEVTAEQGQAFDPRTEVSADAKYIVKQLVLWLVVFPPILALLVWALIHAINS